MHLSQTTPILRSFDEAKAREFYLQFLGFEVVFEHRFDNSGPLYMGIRRGDCMLHLSEHHGDATPGAAMRIAVSDIDAFAAELAAKDYRHGRPHLQDTPWNTRDMTLSDPFGNHLTFTTAIST
ncbi:MAG: VOC family protein [Rubrivivax sp.]|nr:VOC family protein [Rubrivivax sp.]